MLHTKSSRYRIHAYAYPQVLASYNLYPYILLVPDQSFAYDTSIKHIGFKLIGCRIKHKENEGYDR